MSRSLLDKFHVPCEIQLEILQNKIYMVFSLKLSHSTIYFPSFCGRIISSLSHKPCIGNLNQYNSGASCGRK